MTEYKDLLDSILSGGKKKDYLTIIARMFDVSFAVLYDINGRFIAVGSKKENSSDLLSDSNVFVLNKEDIEKCLSEKSIVYIHKISSVTKKTVEGMVKMIAVKKGEEARYMLQLLDEKTLKDNISEEKFNDVCSVLGIAFFNEYRSIEQCTSGKFLDKIMDSDCSLTEIELLCQMNGFNYKKMRSCAIFKYESINNGIQNNDVRVRECLMHSLCKNLEDSQFSLYNTFYKEHLVSFVIYPDGMSCQGILNFCLDYYGKVVNEMNQKGWMLRVALGKYYSGASNIKKALLQAFEAMNLGEMIHIHKRVYPYGCEQLYHIMNAALNQEELREIFDETIGILEKYDEETNNNLTDVVKHLINSGFNLAETAKKMYIHRNTLLYKVDKIKEILEKDPREPRLFVKLILGFYAKKLLFPKAKKYSDEDYV